MTIRMMVNHHPNRPNYRHRYHHQQNRPPRCFFLNTTIGSSRATPLTPTPTQRHQKVLKHIFSPNARTAFARAASASAASGGGEKKVCPVCQNTGLKPCGQCEGTGVNQEDKYGGKDGYKKGQPCWLCQGKRKTMCGNCIDLTDSF
jgi:hypothetical protein